MNKKIFISYYSEDKNKLKSMLKIINKNYSHYNAVVVENRKNPGVPLSDKVEKGIDESDYFMPILTRKSINNQWVNQEIGYAKAKKKIILPIVEYDIVPILKGFIHGQIDLPFSFQGSETNPRKEAISFGKCIKHTLNYLNSIFESHESSKPTLKQFQKTGRKLPQFQIIEPKSDYVHDNYITIKGKGANPGSAVIVITSLYEEYLYPQSPIVSADQKGDWHHERCHLSNKNAHRLVYAIALNIMYADKVFNLLKQYGRNPVHNSMQNFEKILKTENIPYQLTKGKKFVKIDPLLQVEKSILHDKIYLTQDIFKTLITRKNMQKSIVNDPIRNNIVQLNCPSWKGNWASFPLEEFQYNARFIKIYYSPLGECSLYVNMTLSDYNSNEKEGWLNFKPGKGVPHRHPESKLYEFLVYEDEKIDEGDNWRLTTIDLVKDFNKSFKKDNWIYFKLNNIRFRGNLKISKIVISYIK